MQTSTAAAYAAHAALRTANRRDNRDANREVKPGAWRSRRAVARREQSKSQRAKFEKKVRVRAWMRSDLHESDAELASRDWCQF